MMDDDDDIHSPTTVSTSPSPPPSTSVNLPETAAKSPAEESSKALIVPLQLPITAAVHGGGRSGGGGREDCWSEGATGVLIDAWGERYLELSRGNLKQKHWKKVAEIVSSREDYSKSAKTDIQCKNRIDTVKKKYKVEKAKIASGGGLSTWPFFERLDNLIGPTSKIAPAGGDGGRAVALFDNIPLGIPTGTRSAKHYPHRGRGGGNDGRDKVGRNLKQSQQARMQIKKKGRDGMESEEEDEEGEGYSEDSLPPAVEKRQRTGVGVVGKVRKGSGNSAKLLEQAMLKLGEAYERAESAKLQQVMEMEKTRMKFVQELELQRMQFFMKTQMEISQLRHGRRGSNATHHHHRQNLNHNHIHHTGNIINSNSNGNNTSVITRTGFVG